MKCSLLRWSPIVPRRTGSAASSGRRAHGALAAVADDTRRARMPSRMAHARPDLLPVSALVEHIAITRRMWLHCPRITSTMTWLPAASYRLVWEGRVQIDQSGQITVADRLRPRAITS